VNDVTERVADPSAIWRVIQGFSEYFAVVAAVRVGIFDALATAPMDEEALALACATDPERLRLLCSTLVAVDLLERRREAYALTSTSETFLVMGAPRSMRELLVHSPGPWENWPALDATLHGEPAPRPVDADFYMQLVRATFPTQFAAANATAETVRPVTRVLDLGAGSAPWTIALLLANPDATAVVNDLGPVIEAARDCVAQHGLTERCEFRGGDYFAVPLSHGEFDVVVLAHVLRGEGFDGARRLVERAFDALRPAGMLLVAEYFVDDDRNGPLNALLLGMTMIAATPSGTIFTYAECREMLSDAGVERIELLHPVAFQEVMIGHKPGGIA
jgi:SAM-dependent methyltransferase